MHIAISFSSMCLFFAVSWANGFRPWKNPYILAPVPIPPISAQWGRSGWCVHSIFPPSKSARTGAHSLLPFLVGLGRQRWGVAVSDSQECGLDPCHLISCKATRLERWPTLRHRKWMTLCKMHLLILDVLRYSPNNQFWSGIIGAPTSCITNYLRSPPISVCARWRTTLHKHMLCATMSLVGLAIHPLPRITRHRVPWPPKTTTLFACMRSCQIVQHMLQYPWRWWQRQACQSVQIQ